MIRLVSCRYIRGVPQFFKVALNPEDRMQSTPPRPTTRRRHSRVPSLGECFAQLGNGWEGSVMDVSLGDVAPRQTRAHPRVFVFRKALIPPPRPRGRGSGGPRAKRHRRFPDRHGVLEAFFRGPGGASRFHRSQAGKVLSSRGTSPFSKTPFLVGGSNPTQRRSPAACRSLPVGPLGMGGCPRRGPRL